VPEKRGAGLVWIMIEATGRTVQGSNTSRDGILSFPKSPMQLWVPHSFQFSVYWDSYPGK